MYLQLFVSDKSYIVVYPIEKRLDFPDALHQFYKEVGVPIALVFNPAREQTSKAVCKFYNQVRTTFPILEESIQWANHIELYIRLFKKVIRKDLQKSNCPMVL